MLECDGEQRVSVIKPHPALKKGNGVNFLDSVCTWIKHATSIHFSLSFIFFVLFTFGSYGAGVIFCRCAKTTHTFELLFLFPGGIVLEGWGLHHWAIVKLLFNPETNASPSQRGEESGLRSARNRFTRPCGIFLDTNTSALSKEQAVFLPLTAERPKWCCRSLPSHPSAHRAPAEPTRRK